MRSDDFSTEGRSTLRTPGAGVHWFSTLLALCLVLLCAAIGMVGLILPIIPGFLFLMLAALLCARLVPALERRLRRSAWFSSWLDKTRQFDGLPLPDKARLFCWLLLRLAVEAGLVLVVALAWLLRFAFSTPQLLRERR
jgi:uncharacterized membrane protein YbaN (DUF454 family)